MNRYWALVVFFSVISLGANAQQEELRLRFSISAGANRDQILIQGPPIPWTYSPRGVSPLGGRRVVVGAWYDAKIVDLFAQKVTGVISWPQRDSDAHGTAVYYLFSRDRAYFYNYDFCATSWNSVTNELGPITAFDSRKGSQTGEYLIQGVYFDEKGKIGSLVGTQLLSTEETIKLILGNEKFSKHMSARQIEQLKSGEHLIVDGLYYPRDMDELRGYFSFSENDFANVIHPDGSASFALVLGASYLGELFVKLYDEIFVLDQKGKVSRSISAKSFIAWLYSHQADTSSYYTPIMPNGSCLFFVAEKDRGSHFYIADNPHAQYLYELFKAGTSHSPSLDSRSKLESLSTRELKVLRNMVYAAKGYAFSDYDLFSFFEGYEWYAPIEGRSLDSIVLSKSERDFVAVIQSLEAARP